LKLAADEIHVWLAFDAELCDAQVLARLRASLDADELERMRHLRSESLRHQFLVARGMQRRVLAAYGTGIEPQELRFVAGAQGKPNLAPAFESLNLQFNVAHTAGLVALAVSREPVLGVDVENVVVRTAPLDIANRYFTAAESEGLAALPPEARPARFYALWTLKESWLKALGQGLAAGLGNASFALDDRHRLVHHQLAAGDAAQWRFWQFAPSPQHTLALAVRFAGAPLEMRVTLHPFPAASGQEYRAQP